MQFADLSKYLVNKPMPPLKPVPKKHTDSTEISKGTNMKSSAINVGLVKHKFGELDDGDDEHSEELDSEEEPDSKAGARLKKLCENAEASKFILDAGIHCGTQHSRSSVRQTSTQSS
jgi:hypothetical protein